MKMYANADLQLFKLGERMQGLRKFERIIVT